jgi:hypothetical protein
MVKNIAVSNGCITAFGEAQNMSKHKLSTQNIYVIPLGITLSDVCPRQCLHSLISTYQRLRHYLLQVYFFIQEFIMQDC